MSKVMCTCTYFVLVFTVVSVCSCSQYLSKSNEILQCFLFRNLPLCMLYALRDTLVMVFALNTHILPLGPYTSIPFHLRNVISSQRIWSVDETSVWSAGTVITLYKTRSLSPPPTSSSRKTRSQGCQASGFSGMYVHQEPRSTRSSLESNYSSIGGSMNLLY